MSTVTSHAPSITTSSFKRGPIDLEPDKLWKDGLKKRIEEGLQSMVDDAKKARDAELARLPLDHPERTTIMQEYDVAMSNIRGLAQEQFVIELERERQERRWQNGQAMLPQWDRALKSEQQDIMDRIKKESSSPVTANCPDGPLAPEGSFSDREGSAAQEETAPIAELATEPPQPEPTKRTPERKSRTEHRTVNGTRSSVEGRSIAEGTTVAEPRLASDLRPAPVTRPELRSPELRSIDIRPLVFGNPEVMPRELPAALLEKAEKVLGPDRERERNATPAYMAPVRRGSTRGDEHAHAAQLRAAYFQSMPERPERIEPIQLPFLGDESDEEEKIQRPLERRASLRKPSVHERPMDVPMSKSIERQSRPSSERYTARSPSNPIPQIWKPSISPEDEISTSRSHTGLARRGSTASIRSNSSAGVRPSIVEAIPERADSETEAPEPGRADTEEPPQVWQPTLSAREKGKQVPPPRTEEDRYSPGSDHSLHYDEPTTYTSPRHSGGHRPDAMSPPPPSGATRPMGRKASLKSLEDRDQPSGYHSSAWLRSKASFTNEDRGYPSTPYRPGSRATHTQDDRDHYYDHPRPYPTPPISAREYLPFSQGYDSRTDSPYQPEQRSATWRAAMMPESPPKRRPSESRPGFFREPSYGKYSYAPPEDEYPTQYDDYHSSKYAPSSAIPISRPRKASNNDESDWRSWGPDPPLFRRDSRRESGRGHDYYDYMDRDRDRDRDHDYRGRDERDYDHNPRYRTPSYNHDATPSRVYGPRSPPAGYHDLHHRFGGRESRHAPDDDDGDDSEDSERRANRRKRDTEDGWIKPEPRRRDIGDTKTRDHDTRDFDYFASKDDSRRERERRREEEESRRERERKREEEDLRRENERKREEEESRRENERKIKEEESRREKERQREDEELRRERERLRQEDELRRNQEEEDLKRKREVEEVRRERERKREEEESRRERERLRQEEETRRDRERKKEEESRRKREEEAARDLEKKKMEALKLEEEVTRQKEEAEREREAARLLAEQAARKDEEARKREREVRRKEEEARRQEEEAKEKEEELMRKQEEIQKRSEEVQMKEREAKKKEQEAKKKELEAKRKEQEAKRKEEEAKRKEEEAKRKEEELKRKEEEARRKEREAKKKEQEVKRKEEEARKKEEEVRRKEEEAKKREEEAQQKELEARQKEEAIQQREEELRKREEELKRRETEISDRNEAERLQKKFDEEERERREKEEQERKEKEERERKEKEERERKEKEVQERIEQERRRQVEETQNKEHEQPEPERRRHFAKDPERLEQERLQQEEFRKREEQIRRQKRQESLNAEANWGPPPFPHPSSPPPTTPSPAMGRSADPNSTKPPSWTTWGSQAKANPTAPPFTSSQASSSSSSTSSKPRSGSVNSSSTSSFPGGPSFSQSTSPFSGAASSPPTAQEEAEWRRRQEEHFAKQQEQFRREQERLEAVRQQQEGRKAWNKEDYLATIETHNRQWAAVQEKGDLRWRDFPWPMFKVPSNPEEIRIPMIRAYLESDSHPGPDTSKVPRDKEKEVKSRIRDLMKKWHPDRFETVYLKKVVEDERAMVGEGAGSVARALGEILSSVSRSG